MRLIHHEFGKRILWLWHEGEQTVFEHPTFKHPTYEPNSVDISAVVCMTPNSGNLLLLRQ